MRYAKVLLINPPSRGEWKGFRPHIGLGYLAQFLEENGIQYDVLDMNFGYSLKDVQRHIDFFKPNLVGMSLLTLEYKKFYRLISDLKANNPSIKTEMRNYLTHNGSEVGVHGLYHAGNLYKSKEIFCEKAKKINFYLKKWESVGFRSPSMHHNLDWIHELNIEYDASTFDTDPFEPQPDGMAVIFPFFVQGNHGSKGYVELPYTLPQDFTLFILVLTTRS